MATVKGDVHDIGKNIVGVVLALQQLRGHRPRGDGAERQDPRHGARAARPTRSGFRGLITPSLDEMVHVAREMTRDGCTVPLLIGGATTSAAHTAVKIEPEYPHGVVHVLDASRVVNVVGSLLSPEAKPGFMAEVRGEAGETAGGVRVAPGPKAPAPAREARARRQPSDWSAVDIPQAGVPRGAGVRRRPALRDRPLHRLGPVLQRMGAARAVPRHPEGSRRGRRGDQAL